MKQANRRMRGYTITEFLTVMVILTLIVAMLAPLVTRAMKTARVRTATSQLAIDLRAVRLIAVSNRKSVDMEINVEADGNSYSYQDAHGRDREVAMPPGVRIVSSTNPMSFRSNGSVVGGGETVIEVDLNDQLISRWTVKTSPLGITRTEHKKIDR